MSSTTQQPSEAELLTAVRELMARVERSLSSDLWDADDIACFLRLEKKTVQNHYLGNPKFPKPVVLPTGGKRWIASEVKAYAMNRRG